jgi:hypothetical protein
MSYRPARLLPGHVVRSTIYMGWSGLKNGELIARAEADGFEVLIAADQSIRSQLRVTVTPAAVAARGSKHPKR